MVPNTVAGFPYLDGVTPVPAHKSPGVTWLVWLGLSSESGTRKENKKNGRVTIKDLDNCNKFYLVHGIKQSTVDSKVILLIP